MAAHFVRPGGIFYVTEIHPVAHVFDDEDVRPGELRLRYPYFSRDDGTWGLPAGELPLFFSLKATTR